ncbi:hypothetical protein [Hoeflea sp.]|uniref:hypothetical protein n=1 Tax=Hoeflea sp. TaxID=1940281 RepID=UPI003BB0B4BF
MDRMRLPACALSAILIAATLIAAPGAWAGEECECLGNGKRVKEGGVICLQIGSSSRYLARCERNLNNTSWKKISDGCPTASSSRPMSAAAISG